jgi:DNA primase
MPEDFIPVSVRTKATNYLIQRGFPAKDHRLLSEWYDLRFSRAEPWEDHIIFPLYEYNKLLTWTGRSIYNKTKEKYKNLNNDQSIVSLKDTIWNYDWLLELKKQLLMSDLTLYLCEGPFDALKIDFYSNFNIAAVPIFGLTLSDRQLAHLSTLKPKSVKIVLDSDAEMKTVRLKQKLSHLHPQVLNLPKGVKDPGSLSITQIHEFFT